AGAAAGSPAGRPEGHARHSPCQTRRGPALPRREVRETAADRPQRVEGEGRRLQEGSGGNRAQGEGAAGEAAAGTTGPGPLGPGGAVAPLRLPPRGSAEGGKPRRAGGAFCPDRRQDPVRGETSLAGGQENGAAVGVRTLADPA